MDCVGFSLLQEYQEVGVKSWCLIDTKSLPVGLLTSAVTLPALGGRVRIPSQTVLLLFSSDKNGEVVLFGGYGLSMFMGPKCCERVGVKCREPCAHAGQTRQGQRGQNVR